jgi:hypothetical protein
MKRFVAVCVLSLCAAAAYSQAPDQPPGGKEKSGRSTPPGDTRSRPPGGGFAGRELPHARWEYAAHTRAGIAKLGDGDFMAGLNKLGEDGWELVAVEPGGSPARQAEYFLKRAKGPGFAGGAGGMRGGMVGGPTGLPGGPGGFGPGGFDPNRVFDTLSNGKDVINRADLDPNRLELFDRYAQRMGITGGRITRQQFNEYMQQRTAGRGAERPVPDGGRQEKPMTQIVALKYASAHDTRVLLHQLYEHVGNLRLAADERTNSLVVIGPAEEIHEVRRIVSELDHPAAPEREKTREAPKPTDARKRK